MIHVIIGIGVKLIGSFSLAPIFGIYGIIGSTIACFAVVMVLNLYYLKRFVHFHILQGKWIRLAIVTFVVVVSGALIEYGFFAFTSSFAKWKYLLSATIVGSYVLASYVVLIWMTKIVTWNDVNTFPAPLQKLVRLVTR